MWGWLRNAFKKPEVKSYCFHEYQVLERISREIDIANGMNTYTVEDVYIYCPKCRKRKAVTPLEWKLITKQQKIDCEFAKKNEIFMEEGSII